MASTVLVPMTAGGCHQRDVRQLSAVSEQRVGRGLHARRDNAAAEAAVAIDDLDVRGRSEVDHHHRRPVKRPGRHRVGHPVGADLAGVGVIGVEKALGRLGIAHQRPRAGGVLDAPASRPWSAGAPPRRPPRRAPGKDRGPRGKTTWRRRCAARRPPPSDWWRFATSRAENPPRTPRLRYGCYRCQWQVT